MSQKSLGPPRNSFLDAGLAPCQTAPVSPSVQISPSLLDFAALLRSGKLVAFPTETVYGLGADATNSDAVLAIYETKGRPRFNPLIVHCADVAMAETLVELSPLARRLAGFWPGPLTLVLPKKPGAGLSDLVTAGLDSVGIRIPAHRLALELIRAVGRPLAGPSAIRRESSRQPPLSRCWRALAAPCRCSMAAPAAPASNPRF